MAYTWEIKSTDIDSRSMVVEYTSGTQVTLLNLPIPNADAVLADHIDTFAPRQLWAAAALADVVVGTTGQGAIVANQAAPAAATTVGNINEEYLRALIYTVIDEINAAAAPTPAP